MASLPRQHWYATACISDNGPRSCAYFIMSQSCTTDIRGFETYCDGLYAMAPVECTKPGMSGQPVRKSLEPPGHSRHAAASANQLRAKEQAATSQSLGKAIAACITDSIIARLHAAQLHSSPKHFFKMVKPITGVCPHPQTPYRTRRPLSAVTCRTAYMQR